MCAFHVSYFTPSLTIGLDGVRQENSERINEVVLAKLRKVIEEGIDPERIQSVIRHYELKSFIKSQNEGRLIVRAASYGWICGADPISMIDDQNDLNHIKAKLQTNPRLFEDLIGKWLIDNQHHLFCIGKPQNDFMAAWNSRIISELTEIKEKMTDQEKLELNNLVIELHEYAKQEKPVNLFPKMERSDLTRLGRF